MSLEKTHRMNMLFSFYGDLLTDKQRDYMAYYHIEDYSLGEIADLKDVSRQAVYDNIKRSEKALEEYEEALAMYEKFKQLQGLVKELEAYHSEDANYQAILDQLKKL